MESIKQLRVICQHTRDDEFYQSDWLDRNILRRVSIYPTKLFLKAGLSPNKVTFLSFLPAIAAGAFFTFPQPGYWLIGWGLFFLFNILDCCDGEIARYQKSSSAVGEYNDSMLGFYFLSPFLFACISFGIYRALGNNLPIIFGFILLVGWATYAFSPILCEIILGRQGKLHEELERTEGLQTPRILSNTILRYVQMPFNQAGFFFAILAFSLLDMFVSPFLIGSTALNSRFIYFALYALAFVFGSLVRVYHVNRHGVGLQK